MDSRGSLAVVQQTPSRDDTRHLGDYELIAELAQGGMGRVFLSRRKGEAGFERLYAIKVMHDHLASEPEAVTMLIDEANIASRLHHPNVVSTIDMGMTEGRYYMVMDYVEGPTLSELLRRTKTTRTARLIIPLILDSLRGLHEAHELTDPSGQLLNLIHRDFSPQNLLVGIDGCCRVTDFGIAKARARLTKTRPNMQKGKISYMSPEQLVANEGLDRRLDVWAAGVVLWQALTGFHPFLGPSHAATIHSILGGRVPPPSSVGLQPPRCFDSICLKALSSKKENRFSTAQEMADALHQTAMNQDLLASRSEVGKWVKSTFRKEIASRRCFLAAFLQKRSEISALVTPVMPALASPPSPIPQATQEEVKRQETVNLTIRREDSSPRTAPEPTPSQTPAPQTYLQPERQPSRDDTWLKTLVGVTIGVIIGFTFCIALLSALRPPQVVAPQVPTVQNEVVLPQAPSPATSPAAVMNSGQTANPWE